MANIVHVLDFGIVVQEKQSFNNFLTHTSCTNIIYRVICVFQNIVQKRYTGLGFLTFSKTLSETDGVEDVGDSCFVNLVLVRFKESFIAALVMGV